MGAPVLVGAGIGAISSLATGRNPLQGALLGGVTGGAFGGAGGFGSGFTEGGLFASAIPSAGTTAATSAGTAFGANQAPTAIASGVGSGATTAGVMGTSPVSSTVGGIHTGAGVSPESVINPISKYTSAINTSDPAQLARAAKETTGQTFTDGVADQIMPRFSDFTQVSEQATKTGGYEKPLYEQAYDSVINYAKKNPLEIGGLALVASGGIKPRTPQQPVTGSGGSITKGTPPQQAGQILKVKRPTRFA